MPVSSNIPQKSIAVLLAGCGYLDGSEIHEAVLTLLAISQQGATYQCFSLDESQHDVYNHVTATATSATNRNMLVESARIARGKILPIQQLSAQDYAGLIIPGGNGVAANLFDMSCTPQQTVHPAVTDICKAFSAQHKPVGFICISPLMIPVIYANYAPAVHFTLGNDANLIKLATATGCIHHICQADDICYDATHRIISTPAYMLAHNIATVFIGVNKLVTQLLSVENKSNQC